MSFFKYILTPRLYKVYRDGSTQVYTSFSRISCFFGVFLEFDNEFPLFKILFLFFTATEIIRSNWY